MDSSALESALKALANAISTSENAIASLTLESARLTWWLDLWTIMVAVGVVVEVIVIAKEFFHKRKLYLPNTIRSMDKPLFSDLGWELLGAVLVAIGVSGEVWVGIDISDIQSKLARENQKLVGYFNQTATLRSGSAIESASNSDERSKRLQRDNLVLQAKVLELQAQARQRELTAPQLRAISDLRDRFAGRTVSVVSYAEDGDGNVLASQIISSLEAAGLGGPHRIDLDLTGRASIANTFQGKLRYGVWVRGPSHVSPGPYVREYDALAAVLTNILGAGKLDSEWAGPHQF